MLISLLASLLRELISFPLGSRTEYILYAYEMELDCASDKNVFIL